MKQAYIYVRVSSERQVEGYSLDSQEDLCKKKAAQMGYEVVRVFREEGVSGSTLNRPELQDMLRQANQKDNNISAIFLYSFSRLNRNALDYLSIRVLLSKHGVSLISVTEPSGDTPAEKMIGTILAGFNQYQNEERAQNVANSLKRRFMEGNITVKPPLGYLMRKVDGKSVAVKDPVWFPLIKREWERIEHERLTLRQVSNDLNELGILSHMNRRFKRFLPQTAHGIFNNKFYAGYLVSEKYGETKGKHEAMITVDSFYRVRSVLSSKRSTIWHRYIKQREDFPLRGLLRCPVCGNRLSSAWSKGKCKRYPYYMCSTRTKHRIVSINRDFVQPKYEELLDSLTMSEKFMKWFSEIVLEKYTAEKDIIMHAEDEVHRDIAELEETKKTIGMKNAQGLYSDEDYQKLIEEIEMQLAVKRGIVSEQKLDQMDITSCLSFITYYFSHLKMAWKRANLKGKLLLGCLMFPQGLLFENGVFQTPTLGRAYELTRPYNTGGIVSGEPDLSDFKHLIQEYHALYQQLHIEVKIPVGYQYSIVNV